MKNFDEIWDQETEEDRSFVVRGEKFTLRPAVRPERMMEVLQPLDALRADPNSSVAAVMAAMDDFVLELIEPDPDSEARWRALRAREDGGLSAAHLRQIHEWMLERQSGVVEEQTGFPTTSQPASSPTRGRRAGRSTGGSSSPVAAV